MATAPPLGTGCRFGPFALDLHSGDLSKNGRPIRLQEKPRHVLMALAERPGQLLTRTELHERLWSGDTFVDFEDGLNAAMSKLREVLGDDTRSPRYIETVRGRGYRFIAKVEPLAKSNGHHPEGEPAGNSQPQAVLDADQSPLAAVWSAETPASAVAPTGLRLRSRRVLVLWSFLLGCVLSASAAVAWYWLAQGHAVLSYGKNQPVLVADFENQTGDPRFDKALETALAVSLGQSRYVNVYSRLQAANALRLMDRNEDNPITPAIGREICERENIPALIVPAITRAGRNYTLTAQLFNPSTGEVLRSYSEGAPDEDSILHALTSVAAQIRRDLGESRYDIHQSNRPLPQVTTASLRALKEYADGVELFGQGQAVSAVEHYKAAIADDPGFAMAHAALGYADSSFYFNQPKLGEAEYHAALALAARTTDREHASIETRFAESAGRISDAIDLYRAYLARWPSDYDAQFFLARLLRMNGRAAESIPVYQRLIQESPDNAGDYVELATAYRTLNQLPQSIQAYEKAFALDPRQLQLAEVNHEYGATLIADGQDEKAGQVYSRLLAAPDTFAYGQRWLAYLDLYHGRYVSARQRLQLALDKSHDPFSVARIHYMLALVAAGEGNRQEQISQLDRVAAGLNAIGPRVLYGALVGQAYARAGELAKARKILGEIAPLVNERVEEQVAYAEMLKAEVAAASGDFDGALQVEKAPPPDGRDAAAVLTRESLAHLYQEAGKDGEAMRWYQQFLNDGNSHAIGWEPQQQIFNAYYALAQDYRLDGDRASALGALNNLLGRWKTADSNLPLLRQAHVLQNQLVAAR
jgi:eukaryotic-like serine/threonine-protein kinase